MEIYEELNKFDKIYFYEIFEDYREKYNIEGLILLRNLLDIYIINYEKGK